MSDKTTHKYRFAFLSISLLIIFAFSIFPLIYSLVLSLFDGRGNNLQFAGFANYQRLISDKTVLIALFNTTIFTLILAPAVLFISILLANTINRIPSQKMKSIFSVILFFPSITSTVAYSFFFKRFFAEDGFLNDILGTIGFNNTTTNYLFLPLGARTAIVMVCIWAWTGYYTMLILSAMQNIDPILYKSSIMDGANARQILFRVTIPVLKTVILLCSVLLAGGIFQLFAEVMIITKGGPQQSTLTLAYYIYMLCFNYVPQYGYAASIGAVMFLISVVLSIVQIIIGERENEKNKV